MADMTWPWARGSATGVGSLPGTDIVEATKTVFGELPDLPHLPELPARGPGADIIGRGAAFLVDLPVELYASRWRVAARPGRDLRRTLDLIERDLDALITAGDGYSGPVKIQAAGPWTLAGTLDLPAGGRVLHDHGATRDLAGSLTEGLREHVAAVQARMPDSAVILQVDEPVLPAVLLGRIPTESGLGTLRPVEESTVESALRELVAAVGVPVVVHCCGSGPPVALVARTGARAVSIDLGMVTDLDPLGEAIDAGIGLFAGAAESSAVRAPTSAQVADRVVSLWRRLGFPPERLADQVVVTPTCGMPWATPDYARDVLAACVEAGRRLAESA
jgi:methionine synthase II (cobalamin-independent)